MPLLAAGGMGHNASMPWTPHPPDEEQIELDRVRCRLKMLRDFERCHRAVASERRGIKQAEVETVKTSPPPADAD